MPGHRYILALLLLLLTAVRCLATTDSIRAATLYQKGKDLYYQGDYKSARKPLLESLELYKKALGADHEEVMWTLLRIAKNERRMRHHKEALEWYREGSDLALALFGPTSEPVGDFYTETAHTYSQMYNEYTANQWYQKAIDVYRHVFGDTSQAVGDMYNNLAIGSIKMGRYHTATRQIETAHQIFLKTSDPESKDMYRVYQTKSYLYREQGDYDRAAEFGRKALELKLKHYEAGHPSVAKYHANIADCYLGQESFEQALSHMKTAYRIALYSFGKDHPETAGIYGELGSIYGLLGDAERARKMILESIRLQEKTLHPDHPYILSGYIRIGDLYRDEGLNQDALNHYYSVLNRYRQRTSSPGHFVASICNAIAEIEQLEGRTQVALDRLTEALRSIAPSFEPGPEERYSNPAANQIEDEVTAIYILISKADVLYQQTTGTKFTEQLKAGFAAAALAVHLIEKVRKGYQSESAKEMLSSRTAAAYQLAVKGAYLLYLQTGDDRFLIQAFRFAEKSKAGILKQNLDQDLALEHAQLPGGTIEEIRFLQADIAQLEEAMLEADLSSDSLQQIRASLFQKKRQLEATFDHMRKTDPLYVQMSYGQDSIDLKRLQSRLHRQDAMLVSYFYDTESLYAFTVDNATMAVERVPLGVDLPKAIRVLNQGGGDQIGLDEASGMRYLASLNELYLQLVKPIERRIQAYRELIVVPHGILGLLSFEMLAPARSGYDFRNQDYLIKTHSIQYAWSVSLWEQDEFPKRRHDYHFVGFAPGFAEKKDTHVEQLIAAYRSSYGDLKFAIPEIEGANAYFHGRLFKNERATESEFIKVAPNSDIIHLATHGIINNEQPMLSGLLFATDAEEDGFLHAYEIYHLNLDAALAVMSACNTGFGQLAEGEGIMSMGRAFCMPGVKASS